ncbi:hypothetical protein BaRGS_00005896 [Batillaria attramentaria]|uniref:Ig-like domain-containing protein n=1 Tax=Batillaria attramentaria TaxID=370345 RepID=A0ABD0LVH3_9CAEN
MSSATPLRQMLVRMRTSVTVRGLPTSPHISSTCPESYTTDAEAARCTCMTSDLGSPTGTLAWFDPDGNSILSRKTLTLTLPFSYVTSGYNGRPFHCVVLHHTGNSNVSYTPKIAGCDL